MQLICLVGLEPTGPAGESRVSDRAGFTLIEMSLSILILGILSVFTYVKLRPVLEHSKVNGAVAVVAADLQYAQFLAARQRTPIVVIVTPTTKSYVIRDRADASRIFRTRYLDSNTDYHLDS